MTCPNRRSGFNRVKASVGCPQFAVFVSRITAKELENRDHVRIGHDTDRNGESLAELRESCSGSRVNFRARRLV